MTVTKKTISPLNHSNRMVLVITFVLSLVSFLGQPATCLSKLRSPVRTEQQVTKTGIVKKTVPFLSFFKNVHPQLLTPCQTVQQLSQVHCLQTRLMLSQAERLFIPAHPQHHFAILPSAADEDPLIYS